MPISVVVVMRDAPMRPPVVVAIGGYGRSGSTLLQGLLAERLGGVALGEVKYLWSRGFARQEKCSCGETAPDCPFWRPVLEALLEKTGLSSAMEIERLRKSVERNRIFLRHEVLRLPSRSYARRRQRYADILGDLLILCGRHAGRDYLIDSSKDVAHLALLSGITRIRPKLIHLVRDSRAVAFSQKTPKKKAEVWWDTEYMAARGIWSSSGYWIYLNALMRRLDARGDYRVVRYEDVVAAPDATLTALVDWLRHGTQARVHDAALMHAISGNPGRFSTEALALRPDTRWHKAMSPFDRGAVTVMTAPWLHAYGYSLTGKQRAPLAAPSDERP